MGRAIIRLIVMAPTEALDLHVWKVAFVPSSHPWSDDSLSRAVGDGISELSLRLQKRCTTAKALLLVFPIGVTHLSNS
jgi:hypothetical protein